MAGKPIKVWRLVAHHAAPKDAVGWFAHDNVIAIGWGNIGSVEAGLFGSAADVAKAIRKAYPDLRNSGSGGICLYDFCFHMKRGDLVIVSAGARRSVVMEVRGDYKFEEAAEPDPIGDYQHQRRALPIEIAPDSLWDEAGAGPRAGHSIRWTLIECARAIDVARKERLLNEATGRASR